MIKGVIVLLIMLLACLVQDAARAGENLRIVEHGKPMAVVILQPGASEQVKSAAATLQHYIQKSTGAKLPIVGSAADQTEKTRLLIRIWLGRPGYASPLYPILKDLDQDGFIISFPDSRNVLISGASDWGTEFGVYEFLESYVGVRWLFPGDSGEVVPMHSTIDIPAKQIIQKPAFSSRYLSGLKGEAHALWARRNRMHGYIRYQHNLYKLFPPETYRTSHPGFFPLSKGERYLPKDNKDWRWNPCFSALGLEEEAVKNILRHFYMNPEDTSYSLGVNDGDLYCAEGEGRTNVFGFPHVSEEYFRWANAVVRRVLKVLPDKWFGCLAYSGVAEPPATTPVHPRIVPYLTQDRLKWATKQGEEDGHNMTRRWEGMAQSLGWYDYLYGTPYVIPRIYSHLLAECLKYGHASGVKAFTAEAYPNWGEGPKLYLTMKLTWNPDLDVDELLKDWYECAVGKAGASELRQYYDHWERYWMERVPTTKWFNMPGQALYFNDPGYLDSLTYDDISRTRALLESVVAKAETEVQKKRARLFLRAFEYYEASVISYLGMVKGLIQPGRTIDYYMQMDRKRYDLEREFAIDPVLVHPVSFTKYQRLKWRRH